MMALSMLFGNIQDTLSCYEAGRSNLGIGKMQTTPKSLVKGVFLTLSCLHPVPVPKPNTPPPFPGFAKSSSYCLKITFLN